MSHITYHVVVINDAMIAKKGLMPKEALMMKRSMQKNTPELAVRYVSAEEAQVAALLCNYRGSYGGQPWFVPGTTTLKM